MFTTIKRPSILAIALATVWLAACSKTEVAAAPEIIRPVQSMIVDGASATGEQSFSAEIRPQVESRLGFRVGGKITARLVELGATVRKGQPLLKLDASDLQLAASAGAAQVAAAKANDDVAQANLKRVQSLAVQGFVSAGNVDAAQGQAKATSAALQAAQAASSVQANASQYAVLVADAAGVVTGLDAEIGQVVAAGTPVLRVSQGASKDAVFNVPENMLGELRNLRGKTVAVQLWAQPSAKLTAVVRDVAAIADAASRSYAVKASMTGGGDIPLGATATVLLPIRTGAAGAAMVPLSAIIESQGKPAVWVLEAGVVKKRVVQVGAAQGDLVAVVGLNTGAEIVTAGTHTLREGQKVKSQLAGLASTAASAAPAAPVAAPTAAKP
jgi:membrane fusion protein, multidrug efflux system